VLPRRGCQPVGRLFGAPEFSHHARTQHVNQHGRVLVIDADRDIADIVYAVLSDAGFTVVVLTHVHSDAIRAAVGQFEPDCVLLDGDGTSEYGESWLEAVWLAGRERPVPVIMFTVDQQAIREVREANSPRSQMARFDAALSKPFDFDELVDVVTRAVSHSMPFDPSPAAEFERSAHLRAKLEAAGAQNIHVSARREWASFQIPNGALIQIYWWERDGVYYVLRLDNVAGRLDYLGRVHDLDMAIALAMRVRT
jgi:DNA-binding response OmpR family regulator